MSGKLVLVDGSSYLYRAFHAMPNLTNSQGEPTGAVYGVVNMLRRLLKEQPSEYFAVVFDAPGPTFRDQMYPKYKANRPPMPDELRGQIQPLHDVISALGLPLICVKGVEADDVIASVADRLAKVGSAVTILSTDKSFCQLLGPKIRVHDHFADREHDRAWVKQRFEVEPEQLVDLFALAGDSSLGIRGIYSIGVHTAVKLLTDYGNLEGVLDAGDAIAGRLGAKVRSGAADARLAARLVALRRDVSLDTNLKAFRFDSNLVGNE